MKALLANLNHYWPLVTLIAALLPSPIKKLQAWIDKKAPGAVKKLLLRLNYADALVVINILSTPTGGHDIAVQALMSATKNSDHPLDANSASVIVSEIAEIYANVIAERRQGK